MGYDGIELAIWGNHLDPIRAAKDDAYVAEIKKIFDRHGLVVGAMIYFYIPAPEQLRSCRPCRQTRRD